jgi:oxidase EvaA
MTPCEVVCKKEYSFKVVFCRISIEGREVRDWAQPFFEAIGTAIFGLIMCNIDGIKKFLIYCKPEIGSFDGIEFGPTVQIEAVDHDVNNFDEITKLFMNKLQVKSNVKYDVLLSEEGGRFFHEQNRNIIMNLPYDEIPHLPPGYLFLDYYVLNQLVQINNCLNIQLRNLLSLLEI